MRQLYWTARITLVRRRSELDVFDAVFTGTVADPSRPLPGSPSLLERAAGSGTPADSGGLPWMTRPAAAAGSSDRSDRSDPPVTVSQRLPSALEGLLDTPFEELNPGDLALLGRWLESAVATWPTRRSRQTAVSAAGSRVALRPTVARARRTGFEPIQLVRVRPVRKPRRIVM